MYWLHHFIAFTAASAAATPIKIARDTASLVQVTADAIVKIAPKTASCAGASPADQCRTAQQAAPAIQNAINEYKITTKGEAAAVIATQAYESVEFRYNKNVYPGRPGQGTRNMQMIDFNLKYAQSIPALKSNLTAIVGPNPPATSSMSDDTMNAIRGLVISNDCYDFGSGFWFLTTQCTQTVRQGLQAGTDAGFAQFLQSCVGVTMDDDRKAYWTKALQYL